jgi:hypothetical protein
MLNQSNPSDVSIGNHWDPRLCRLPTTDPGWFFWHQLLVEPAHLFAGGWCVLGRRGWKGGVESAWRIWLPNGIMYTYIIYIYMIIYIIIYIICIYNYICDYIYTYDYIYIYMEMFKWWPSDGIIPSRKFMDFRATYHLQATARVSSNREMGMGQN